MLTSRILLLLILFSVSAKAQDIPPELLPPEGEPILTEQAILQAIYGIIPDSPVTDSPIIKIGILLAADVSTNVCQAAINNTNLVYTNSQLDTRVELAGCLPTTYVSSGVGNTDLMRLRNVTDGFLDFEATTWRDSVYADVIALIGKSGDVCGLAPALAGHADAFMYVLDICIGNKTFVHELGHLFGLMHDKPNAPATWYPSYAYGHCHYNGKKCVMTYGSPCGGSRIDMVSNPLILVDGQPFGSFTESDGARIIRNRTPNMAAFRLEVAAPGAPGVPSHYYYGGN